MSIPSKPIGKILQMNRYPVKSFAGESLEHVSLETYGLQGDRSHALVDPAKEGWARYITARQIPQMLQYKAEVVSSSLEREELEIIITGPDGRVRQWDEHLLMDIQALLTQKIAMERFSLESNERLAVDDGQILIVTKQSLEKIDQLYGKHVDVRRFRANFVLSLYDDFNGDESELIGKHLWIGNSEICIQSFCERCSVITMDPDTLLPDPRLLKKINERMNLTFGLYADVVSTGRVSLGDQVYILE